jgi:hypothetical protein
MTQTSVLTSSLCGAGFVVYLWHLPTSSFQRQRVSHLSRSIGCWKRHHHAHQESGYLTPPLPQTCISRKSTSRWKLSPSTPILSVARRLLSRHFHTRTFKIQRTFKLAIWDHNAGIRIQYNREKLFRSLLYVALGS